MNSHECTELKSSFRASLLWARFVCAVLLPSDAEVSTSISVEAFKVLLRRDFLSIERCDVILQRVLQLRCFFVSIPRPLSSSRARVSVKSIRCLFAQAFAFIIPPAVCHPSRYPRLLKSRAYGQAKNKCIDAHLAFTDRYKINTHDVERIALSQSVHDCIKEFFEMYVSEYVMHFHSKFKHLQNEMVVSCSLKL